jgi:hypothetical protein
VFFCGNCTTRLWSKYYTAPGDTLLVRVGTLDHPERVEPDVHIFTRSKLPWLQLPPDKPAFEAFYKIPEGLAGRQSGTVAPQHRRPELTALH